MEGAVRPHSHSKRAHGERVAVSPACRKRQRHDRPSRNLRRHDLHLPACKTILGRAPEELQGVNIFDLIHEEDRAVIRELFDHNSTDATYTVTFRASHMNGAYIWLETSARAVLDPNTKKAVEIQSASRDITERKRAEEALQQAHKQLSEAYERTIEGWVRALDLRDRETEGHTQRVTEITLKVAKQLGYSRRIIAHPPRRAPARYGQDRHPR
ncbi:MAG: PAS domain S-box protein [Haliscomenobacter sp.]|nr:PAS domain S-box protein [Haliscomenobacter sp.]